MFKEEKGKGNGRMSETENKEHEITLRFWGS